MFTFHLESRIAREISLRSRRTSHQSQFRVRFEQNIVEKQFLLATWQMRNVLSRVTPNRAETPRGRARLFPASASRRGRHRLAQRAVRANSSTTAAARAFCPGAVWKLRGCSPAPRPRAAAPPPRAHRAGGRLGVGGGPRFAFLCVSGTTRARARGSRPAPAPRRAPTRCPSRPPRTNRWRAGRGRARMRERRRVRLAGFPTRATREMHGRTSSAETIARRLG